MGAIKDQKKIKTIRLNLKLVVLASLLALTIWCLCLDSNETVRSEQSFQTLHTGWVQLIDGVEYPLEQVQMAHCPAGEDTIVLQTTVPTMSTGSALLFYTTHQDVAVYIDDVCVHTLTCPESMAFYGSAGRTWVDVAVDRTMVGETLRLEISSPFSQYRSVPTDLYFIHSHDVLSVQFNFVWIRSIVALAILVLAGISYVNANIWVQKKLRRFLFGLADLFLFTALWLCLEINLLAPWFGHASAVSFLSMVFLRMIPLVFYYFVCSVVRQRTLWVRALGTLAWVNLIGAMVAQMLFGVSLVATLPIHYAVVGISCVCYLIGIVCQCAGARSRDLYDGVYYTSALILVTTMVEVFFCINEQTLGEYNGFAVSFGCLVYAWIVHVLLVRYEAETETSKRKLERAYGELEAGPLNQQINAHFLYNTLNTISAYCKEDPKKADRAVGWLAQYMRGYMHHINGNTYVPFSDSIALMRHYMNIQNLRFEEEIVLKVDIDDDAFVVPPLTLQPLVENAINHGIHGHVSKGIVSIQTKWMDEFVEVTVSDNGCGFSVETQQMSGLGLDNLRRRIRAMGGDMRVESIIGQGTRVTLNIPLVPVGHK